MLKHTGPTTTAAGPQTAGQLRSNSSININNNNNNNNTSVNSISISSSSNNNNNGNPPARGIHLRPQQPLNISTLSANNLSTTSTPGNLSAATTTPAAATTTNGAGLANGGPRLPTLLHLASPGGGGGGGGSSGAAGTTGNTNLPMANGIGPNLHTYSNQHVGNGINHNGNNINTSSHNPNHTYSHSINHNNNSHTHNYSNCHNLTGMSVLPDHKRGNHGPGPREALTSLGLLCLVSLLLALLSLIFLLKISPTGREDAGTRSPSEDFVIVYDVTLALCALSLSLNLCCLLVCAIQFLFAVKLVRSPMFDGRDNKYLEKSSTSRTCAVGGFFISIPIFLTGIILYTFNHFHSTPAIITSVLIGVGIVFCGCAMVHNVFIWQKEKTISYRSPPQPPLPLPLPLPAATTLASAQSLQTVLPAGVSLLPSGHLGAITPPAQFLNHSSHLASPFGASAMQQQQQQLLQPTSVTPVSPNHSHGSFNPLAGGAISSSFLMRPATATPPTPKPPPPNGGCLALGGREASGSVSPGLPAALDMSNVTSASLHELSTLV